KSLLIAINTITSWRICICIRRDFTPRVCMTLGGFGCGPPLGSSRCQRTDISGSPTQVLEDALHPFSGGLLGGDHQAIPRIDRRDRDQERCELRIIVMAGGLLPPLVRNRIGMVRETGDDLSQRQGGSLRIAEIRRFAPRRDGKNSLIALASVDKLAGVHVEA